MDEINPKLSKKKSCKNSAGARLFHSVPFYFFLGASGFLSFAPFCLFSVFLGVFSYFFGKIYQNRVPFRDIFAFFMGFYISNLYWIAYPLTFDFAAHFWLIPLAIIFIPGCLSLPMLLPFLALKCINKLYLKILLLPFLCTVVIVAIGLVFPWVLPAYIWNSHELFMQTLSIYGSYGLSFVTILITSLIGGAIVLRRENQDISAFIYISAAVSIFLGMCIFGIFRLANNPSKYSDIRVCMVQPNITDEAKKENRREALQKLINMSYQSENVDLIIWPEASIPYLYNEHLIGLHQMISAPLKNRPNSYLIAGAVREDSQENIYNSAVLIDCFGRNIRNYDKMHLVPFGEYIPLRPLIPEAFKSITSDIGDFSVGDLKINNNPLELQLGIGEGEEVAKQLRAGFVICYEAVFARDCLKYEDKTDVLINLTNDGWFGLTTQPFQHLQIVRSRAVEMGLPIVRVANIGMSAVFDPIGRMITHISLGKTTSVNFLIPKKLEKQTLFMRLFLKKIPKS